MFTDTDPLEEEMHVRCEDMTSDQLTSYFQAWQHHINGVNLKLDGQEWRRMAWLQEVYGQADAGNIVKWVCWKHRGKIDGEIVTHRRFNSRMKWWVDKMHIGMQMEIRREQRKPTAAAAGFATGADLL